MFENLFDLRKALTKQQRIILGLGGILFILALWLVFTSGANPMVKSGILPHPLKVFTAYGDLYADNNLIQNTCKSIGLNLSGYVAALLFSIPIGFLIGLFGFFRGSFQPHVDAIRFVPLTAVTGIFITWFGIGISMKTIFLAFGIVIYLLPTIVVRIDEVKDVYLKTVYTLGASKWQTIKTVYFPAVMSKISDDIRVLTAISWTYIIVAEGIGDQGGLGSLIFKSGQRMGRPDKTFAILLMIIVFGVFQDKLFAFLDRKFFPHKYQTKPGYHKTNLKELSIWDTIWDYVFQVMKYIFIAIYIFFAISEFFPLMGEGIKPMTYLFGGTQWVVHFIFLIAIFRMGYKLILSPKSSTR